MKIVLEKLNINTGSFCEKDWAAVYNVVESFTAV